MVIASTGNLTKKHTSNVVAELIILRSLGVTGHPSIAPKIIQVDWIPPSCRWNKVKTDGTAKGSPRRSREGAIFRDCSGAVLGCCVHFCNLHSCWQG